MDFRELKFYKLNFESWNLWKKNFENGKFKINKIIIMILIIIIINKYENWNFGKLGIKFGNLNFGGLFRDEILNKWINKWNNNNNENNNDWISNCENWNFGIGN